MEQNNKPESDELNEQGWQDRVSRYVTFAVACGGLFFCFGVACVIVYGVVASASTLSAWYLLGFVLLAILLLVSGTYFFFTMAVCALVPQSKLAVRLEAHVLYRYSLILCCIWLVGGVVYAALAGVSQMDF